MPLIRRRRIVSNHAALYVAAPGGSAAFVAGSAHASANGYAGSFSRAMNGGSTYPTCVVIIGVWASDSTAPSSPQIGGTAMTLVATNSGGDTLFFAADVTAGNGDNFTISNGTGFNKVLVAGCHVTGLALANISGTTAVQNYGANSDPQQPSTTLTVPSGGFGISFMGAFSAQVGTPTGVTWTSTTASAGDATAINGMNGAATLAHTATPGAGWNATVAAAGGGANFNFTAGMVAITIG